MSAMTNALSYHGLTNMMAEWLTENQDAVFDAFRTAAERCERNAQELREMLPSSGYARVLDEAAAVWRDRRVKLDKIMDQVPEDFEPYGCACRECSQ